VPCAYILSRYTALPAINVFAIVSSLEFIKCIIGFCLVKSGVWVRNIVK
jgi:Na+-driven multidrug efflux pump